MPSHFRPKAQQPDFDQLKATLAQIRSKTEDPALYQVLFNLITRLSNFQGITSGDITEINASVNTINTVINNIADRNRTYLTAIDESLYLPNSRELIAGDNIAFDDSVANERTVSSVVQVDAAGALDGDGSTLNPLAVRVDGSTITINGSNQLESTGGGSGMCFVPMVTGAEPLEIMSDGAGNLLLIGYTP